MNNRAKRGRQLFFFLAATILPISALIVIAKITRPNLTRRITIVSDSNGVPHLAGMSLSNTNLRDATFTTMHAMGLKAGLAVPPLTNGDPKIINVLDTLESMKRAGLFGSTNSSSKSGTNYTPSPFE